MDREFAPHRKAVNLMKTNELPHYDDSHNTTGCCARFNPEGWDAQHLRFERKPFVRATTKSENHVPIDMGEVFQQTFGAIMHAGAHDPHSTLVLSRDISPAQGEHFFAVTNPVPGQEMAEWTGDYATRVFEGPFEDQPKWEDEFRVELATQGQHAGKTYMFYTTCPGCAEAYGENYVVAVAELDR